MSAGEITEEPLLHVRDYKVEVFRHSPTVMRLRGALKDVKPDGLWLAEDQEPLVVHHMIVDLFVEVPSMEILDVEVDMSTKPNLECADAEPSYKQLVGLSVARGFSHKVKELFGGPRACTHVTILLQAMAPAAIQALFAMTAPVDGETPVGIPALPTDRRERQLAHFQRNRNTCHVWADDGIQKGRLDRGEDIPPPIWGAERLERLGIPLEEWYDRQAR